MIKTCTKCGIEKDHDLDFNKETRPRYKGTGKTKAQCKVCERLYCMRRREALRDRVFKILGEKCTRCGFSDRRALQVDHVNGGGCQEHKEITNPQKYYAKVLADTDGNYQILCANCNWIKRHEENENPTYDKVLKAQAAKV